MKGLWKRFAAGISAVALTIGWHGQAAEAVPERYVVACVGDSITEGIGATSPVLYSYPAQLQKLLGERYEVHKLRLWQARRCSSPATFPIGNRAATGKAAPAIRTS